MKPNIKNVTELVEKDYTEIEAIALHAIIKRDPGLLEIWRLFPHLGYGVEDIVIVHKSGREEVITYINAGDSYSPTLIRGRNGKIIISTIGDVIESLPSTWSVR